MRRSQAWGLALTVALLLASVAGLIWVSIPVVRCQMRGGMYRCSDPTADENGDCACGPPTPIHFEDDPSGY